MVATNNTGDNLMPGLIQPVVFTIEPESDLWSADMALLYLPDEWLGPLQVLQAEKNGRPDLPNSIEVRSLNSVLRTLFPQVYTALAYVPAAAEMFRGGPGGGRRPWLLASSPIDTDSLWRIFRAWLSVTYAGCPGYRAVHDGLGRDALCWETVRMQMAQGTSSNGTINLHPDAYKVLPTLIAHRLAGIPPSMRGIDGTEPGGLAEASDVFGLQIEVHREARYLMRVPCSEGAELVSWPPSYHKQVPYSYMVRVTAQTVAGDPAPRIHMHYGVRRWVHSLTDSAGKMVMRNRNYSTFLRAMHAWSSQGVSNAFTVARLKPVKDAVGARVPVWNDNVPDILELAQAGFAEQLRLPKPEDLVRSPADWLRSAGVEGVQAAITYAVTPLGHEVKQGLSLDVHERLTQAIAERARGQLSLSPPLTRLKPVTNASGRKNPLTMRLREIDKLVGKEGYRLEALADSVGPAVTVEIYWQTPAVRDHLAAQIVRLLTWDERPKEQTGTDAPEDDSRDEDVDFIPPFPLPAEAQLGVMLPGMTWDDLSSTDTHDSQGWQADAYDDPELAFYAQELGVRVGALETSYQGVSNQDTFGPGSRTRNKPKRVPDPAPPPAAECHEVDMAGKGTLRIVTIPVAEGGIGSLLDNSHPARSARRVATNKRAAQIAAYLSERRPAEDGAPILALVELPNYSQPTSAMRALRPADPKMAIRIGMMGTGRVTQFIAPPDPTLDIKQAVADLEHRAEMSVRDGLRQLGYMPSGIEFQPKHPQYALPSDLVVAAVWMLRLTHKRAQQGVFMPVVVMMRTSERQVWAWLPDGKSPSVRPYRQALLDMYDVKPESVSRRMAGQNLAALKQFVHDELLHLGNDVLILASAQNARALWPAMANGAVSFDHLHFERQGQPLPVAEQPGRPRVVRLRTSERGETPEYYWPGCRPGGSRMGIWCADGKSRLFFNIGDKPKTTRNSVSSKDENPSEYYAIPSALEVVPLALQPGDDATAWVNAVYQWRKMGYLTNDMTLLPLPMVLAARMDEYAQAIGPRVLSWEWDRIVDDDDEEDE